MTGVSSFVRRKLPEPKRKAVEVPALQRAKDQREADELAKADKAKRLEAIRAKHEARRKQQQAAAARAL